MWLSKLLTGAHYNIIIRSRVVISLIELSISAPSSIVTTLAQDLPWIIESGLLHRVRVASAYSSIILYYYSISRIFATEVDTPILKWSKTLHLLPRYYFFIIIITIIKYNPESNRKSEEWPTTISPRPKKAQMSKSKIKSLLVCFCFDRKWIVNGEFE